MHRAIHNKVRLRSAVPGRMRWEAAGLRNHPRKAAAVEMALGHMLGILSVEATPLTGRLLVHYDTGLTVEEITAMVRAALETPALTPEASEAMQDQTVDPRGGVVPIRPEDADRQSHDPESGRMLLRGHWRRFFLAGLVLMHRVPVRLLGVLFFLLLALAVTVSWLATWVLLVLSLLIVPSATAQLLTARLSWLIVYAVGCAASSVCFGLWLATQILWLPSAFMAISSFAWYLGVRALVVGGGSARRRPASERGRRAQRLSWSPVNQSGAELTKSTAPSAPMWENRSALLPSHHYTSIPQSAVTCSDEVTSPLQRRITEEK